MSITKPPIVLISFDRPYYLGRLLESLAEQPGLTEERIHLFQDGAKNRYSGRITAEQADIDACVQLFRSRFPHGQVHTSPDNIGIDENILRAERFVFEKLDAEHAYFIEDDFLPAPNYLQALDRVYEAVRHVDRIGYFAAYGDFRRSLERQRANPQQLIMLGNHVAFGLKRSHWQAMQPLMQPFYELAIGTDLKQRPAKDIIGAMSRDRMAPVHSGQDNIKAYVTTLLGHTRLNTAACFGRYVGETGQNMTPKLFVELGFSETSVYDGPVPESFRTPPAKSIDQFVAQMTEFWSKAWQKHYG